MSKGLRRLNTGTAIKKPRKKANNKPQTAAENSIEGVLIKSDKTEFSECTWVEIQNDEGVRHMGRPIGNYVTLETNIMEQGNSGDLHRVAENLARYIEDLMCLQKIEKYDSVLVVGIGNRTVTADSLGVRVADKIYATRHVAESIALDYKVRPISVVAPGVMGVTGIDTSEIIKGICEQIKPSLVIVIDALAARCADRIFSTIQVTDTGVTPGSGLMHRKAAINQSLLGVPVLCIGIPTVIDVTQLVGNVLETALMVSTNKERGDSCGTDTMNHGVELFNGEMLAYSVSSLFHGANPFVTPKEIDEAVAYSSYVISTAINMALFQEQWLGIAELNKYW